MNCVLAPDSLLAANGLFRLIYEGVGRVAPCWMAFALAGFAMMFLLTNFVLLGAAVFSWLERRLLGRMQYRWGPNRWGPFGLFQPIADLFKLLLKEDLTPATADKLLFNLVPVAMLMPVILLLAVIPFARHVALANLNVGLIYIVAVTSLTTLAVFMAGWASNNRYAMFGAARGVAVLISYEVPLVLSLLGIAVIVGSLSIAQVVEAQVVPFILVQPLSVFVFLASSAAELNRTPFDLAEAESELVAGYHTEYSGVKFAIIQAAEFGGVCATSAVLATLFLGGWAGPFNEYLGWLWFLLKTGVFIFVFIWMRGTFPRLRIDQIMDFCWKFLLPLSLINVAATTLEVYFLRGAEGQLSANALWIMAAVNLAVGIAAVAAFGWFARRRELRKRPGVFRAGALAAAPAEAQ